MKIYLDDWRPAPEGYEVARTFNEFQKLINEATEEITHVSLDYDLDSYNYNGLSICNWMVDTDFVPKNINIHSTHSFAEKMEDYLIANVANRSKITRNKYL